MKINRPATRAGFTMIELLIVILLMSIMMAMLLSVLGGVIGTSRQAATKSTIIKISRMLEERVEAFHRYMNKLDKRAGDDRFPRYVKRLHLQQAGGRRKLALILARKDEFRRQFPQIFSEDDVPNSLNWPQNDPNFIPDNISDRIHLPETESSECLYHFLMQGETFGGEPITADAFTSSEVTDTDGDGLLEFVDSWGKPLRFYRWPTRLIRPNPALNPMNDDWYPNDKPWQEIRDDTLGVLLREFKFKIDETAAAVIFGPLSPAPASVIRLPNLGATLLHELEDPLSRDGDDPLGLTFRSLNTGNLPPFDRLMSPANFENLYHTASTYHVPLIISAGPDGELGLYEPFRTEDLNNNGILDEGILDENEDRNENGQIDRTFGDLAQPIISSADPLVVDEALLDNISNIFLRSGVTR